MKKIKVLIADDNLDLSFITKENLEINKQIEVVGIAKDGIEAIELTKTLKPDVLILDIIMPNLDGIGTLEQLQLENINVKTIVLSAMLSYNKQEKLYDTLLSLGASYIMTKPFDVNSLINRILEMSNNMHSTESNIINNIHDTHKNNDYFTNNINKHVFNSSTIFKEESLESKITNIMHLVGIPAKLKGYQYIRESVIISINNGNISNKITKDIYPEVAKKFNTTPTRVERAIRHALEISWKNDRGSISNLLFGNPFMFQEKRPTNSEFIASIADKLKLESKQLI